MPGVHDSLGTAPKTNALLTLGGRPNTHPCPTLSFPPSVASLGVQAISRVSVQIPSPSGSVFSDHQSGFSLGFHELLQHLFVVYFISLLVLVFIYVYLSPHRIISSSVVPTGP